MTTNPCLPLNFGIVCNKRLCVKSNLKQVALKFATDTVKCFQCLWEDPSIQPICQHSGPAGMTTGPVHGRGGLWRIFLSTRQQITHDPGPESRVPDTCWSPTRMSNCDVECLLLFGLGCTSFSLYPTSFSSLLSPFWRLRSPLSAKLDWSF